MNIATYGITPMPRDAEELEVVGGLAGAALVVGREVAADDQADAEGGDEAVDVEQRDDQPAGQADQRRDRQCGEHAAHHVGVVAGHDPAGDQRGQAGDVRDREVEAAGQDHQRLADRDEARARSSR